MTTNLFTTLDTADRIVTFCSEVVTAYNTALEKGELSLKEGVLLLLPTIGMVGTLFSGQEGKRTLVNKIALVTADAQTIASTLFAIKSDLDKESVDLVKMGRLSIQVTRAVGSCRLLFGNLAVEQQDQEETKRKICSVIDHILGKLDLTFTYGKQMSVKNGNVAWLQLTSQNEKNEQEITATGLVIIAALCVFIILNLETAAGEDPSEDGDELLTEEPSDPLETERSPDPIESVYWYG